jgi:hypothetical protein
VSFYHTTELLQAMIAIYTISNCHDHFNVDTFMR